ncbi:helix-turn-helix transcriptional regulator [Micromonospora lupini]|uniref:helix-turn-helix domain-containing protein n=1 Tax=Micromonospora lupini TaxID=285679 RepID=UPI00225BA834|nr:helix-turn-helix transcriptional regulator [Micromonospora lupini]MCX5068664.1 helix-turn-helix transcriptional regulator [Micromonospora lupini]
MTSVVSTATLIREQLRRSRLAAGLSQEEYGKKAHYSPSMVSSVELGHTVPNEAYLKRADEVLDTGGLLTSLRDLGRRDREPVWFRPWLEVERVATQLRCFGATMIPGLLQTADYARAVFQLDLGLTAERVEELVAARLERQAILDREHPPQLTAVIDEAALQRFAEGCAGVLADQLRHLVACARRPHIRVHVLPQQVGLHAGLFGPFILGRTTDGSWLGFLDNQTGGTAVDDIFEVATLLGRWESLRSDALPRQQSIDLLEEIVKPWI